MTAFTRIIDFAVPLAVLLIALYLGVSAGHLAIATLLAMIYWRLVVSDG